MIAVAYDVDSRAMKEAGAYDALVPCGTIDILVI